MIYQDFEKYFQDQIIRDRAFFVHGHFLEMLNEAMLRFAQDLSTIDPTFYYQEQDFQMLEDQPINLGKILGFAGGYDQYGKTMPIVKVGNYRSFLYGLRETYNGQNTEITLVTSPYTYNQSFDLNPVKLIWSRVPVTVTGVATQPLDFPENHKYELSVLLKYFYYKHRDFEAEAHSSMQEYRMLMNNYVKRRTPDIMAPELGRSMPVRNFFNRLPFR